MDVPTRQQRLNILDKCTRRMNLHSDVSLEHVARESQGCVARDLVSLCQVAGMQVVQRLLPNLRIGGSGEGDSPSLVTAKDFDVRLR